MAVKKSQGAGTVAQRLRLVETYAPINRKRQCELLGVARSSSYYKPVQPTPAQREEEERLLEALQELRRKDSTLGYRRLQPALEHAFGLKVGRKRILALLAKIRQQ